ncbi:hypothetical protein GW17_00025666, partial [Ensete ventricosum]
RSLKALASIRDGTSDDVPEVLASVLPKLVPSDLTEGIDLTLDVPEVLASVLPNVGTYDCLIRVDECTTVNFRLEHFGQWLGQTEAIRIVSLSTRVVTVIPRGAGLRPTSTSHSSVISRIAREMERILVSLLTRVDSSDRSLKALASIRDGTSDDVPEVLASVLPKLVPSDLTEGIDLTLDESEEDVRPDRQETEEIQRGLESESKISEILPNRKEVLYDFLVVVHLPEATS